MAALFNPTDDILCLPLHPLQQMLGRDYLRTALDQEVCPRRPSRAPEKVTGLPLMCLLGLR